MEGWRDGGWEKGQVEEDRGWLERGMAASWPRRTRNGVASTHLKSKKPPLVSPRNPFIPSLPPNPLPSAGQHSLPPPPPSELCPWVPQAAVTSRRLSGTAARVSPRRGPACLGL